MSREPQDFQATLVSQDLKEIKDQKEKMALLDGLDEQEILD